MKSYSMRNFDPGSFQLWSFLNRLLIAIVFAGTIPMTSNADSLVTDPGFIDDPFEDFIFSKCVSTTVSAVDLQNEGWTIQQIIDYNTEICLPLFGGRGSLNSSGYSSTSGLGTSGAQSKSSTSVANQQVSSIKERLAELDDEPEQQKGGWGLLLSAQQGETERVATNRENGYDSDLDGLVIGGDYRFNDSLVLGFAVSDTTDEARFIDNSGTLETESNAVTVYVTYVPVAGAHVDAYIGSTSLDFNSRRGVTISGDATTPLSIDNTISSSFSGSQELVGLSGGYDWYVNGFSIGPYAALDYNRTEIDSYQELGSTNFELIYPDQVTHSKLFSAGLNVGYPFGFGWGTLVPSFSMAKVHEAFDEARRFDVRLIIMPDLPANTFELQTDSPDKDYNLTTLGLTAALNNGTQIFFSYEQISAHDFVDTWAVTAGVLAEF